ncbi:MAG: hypothetical protein HYY18_03760 [Planctomycetes bacterium]|nr:hypothetical protein [Planctomycetota bacterium]
MKTALLTVPRGWDVRSLMRTPVVDTLRAGGVRPVILTPKATEPEFQKEFAHLDLEYYEPYLPGRLEGTYRRALNVAYAARFPEHTLDKMASRLASYENREHPVKRAFWGTVRCAARVLPLFYETVRTAEPLMPLDPRWGRVFDKWKPDAVITTPLFDWTDLPVIKWARKRRVPCASIVASWDNVSSKGTVQVRPDALVVWNDDMAREAHETHGFPLDRVAVTGVPHFDHWVEPGRTPRDEFMRRHGLDPSKKLICYCGAGARVHPEEYECFDHLVRANEAGEFGDCLPIFVRLHPRDGREQWDRWRGRPGIVIDKPQHSKGKDWDANRADLDHLADTLRAGDVSMNVCSTITIEACIADRPVFNIGYDGDRKKDVLDSAARYYLYSHYKRVPDCGIPVAYSRKDLILLTKACLADPGRDREARARVVKALCGTVGGAAERMGRALASFVHDGPGGITKF